MCYAYHIQRPRDKLASRSQKCKSIGNPLGKKGCKVYDLETGDIFVSRDVISHGEIYPFDKLNSVDKGGENSFGKKDNLYVEDDFDDCVKDNTYGQITMPNFTNFGEVGESHQESGSDEFAAPETSSPESSPARNGSRQAQSSPSRTGLGPSPV